jgi:hypothetical protein
MRIPPLLSPLKASLDMNARHQRHCSRHDCVRISTPPSLLKSIADTDARGHHNHRQRQSPQQTWHSVAAEQACARMRSERLQSFWSYCSSTSNARHSTANLSASVTTKAINVCWCRAKVLVLCHSDHTYNWRLGSEGEQTSPVRWRRCPRAS